MAIKRYVANADNTITNAYKEDFNTQGTGSNMGQADILEVFSLYAHRDSGSAEIARSIIKFPISVIAGDRTAGDIPASGSVSFYLKMYNADHARTLPRDYYMTVAAIKNSWEEGQGLDMENYSDLTYNKIGSNWIKREGNTSWTTAGGDWYTDSSSSFKQRFEIGNEDLNIDVTTLVEQWINSGGNVLGSKTNNGFMVKLSASYEASSSTNLAGANKSYYTKKFFGRSSEFFFNRPIIEARWDSSRRDNRGNFYLSSSLLPATDNLNNLFMYNYFKGQLRDIAGKSNAVPTLKLYYSSGSVPEGTAQRFRNSSNAVVTSLAGTRVSTGVYKVLFSATSSVVTDTYPYLVDVWTYSGEEIHTGSAFTPIKHSLSNTNPNSSYVISMPNLKESYATSQTDRFRLYVREKNWSPNIYTKAVSTPETLLIDSASYKITRLSDNRDVIPYDTGSNFSTVLSYDSEGNYFDLDIGLFEAGYTYGIRYAFYEDSVGSWREQPNTFKFRVIQDPELPSGEAGDPATGGGSGGSDSGYYSFTLRRDDP